MGRSTIVRYDQLDWLLVEWFHKMKDGAVVIRTIAEFIHYDKVISCIPNCLSFYFATPIVNGSIVAATFRPHDDGTHTPTISLDSYHYASSSNSSSSSSSPSNLPVIAATSLSSSS
jgi:hypothetical protein